MKMMVENIVKTLRLGKENINYEYKNKKSAARDDFEQRIVASTILLELDAILQQLVRTGDLPNPLTMTLRYSSSITVKKYVWEIDHTKETKNSTVSYIDKLVAGILDTEFFSAGCGRVYYSYGNLIFNIKY